MAEAATLHDAFIDELRDTYDAEKQLTKALAKWPRRRRIRNCALPSRPISRRRRARSNVWSRCSRVWTRSNATARLMSANSRLDPHISTRLQVWFPDI